MAKYIDAEAVITGVRKIRTKHAIEGTFGAHQTENIMIASTLEAVAQMLEVLPAADVQEVKHGEWKLDGFVDFDDGTSQVMLKCSVCGTTQGVMTDYCPNCGASMDGDTE